MDWYIPTASHQMGLSLHYEKSGTTFPVETVAGVQIYRVLQEALNNVSRHSGEREAWVRLKFSGGDLGLDVEDHGKGFSGNGSGQGAQRTSQGIGLVGMRERAELIGGTLELLKPNEGGTLVRLTVPRERAEAGHGG
jgi:signal transduction histidine kinase